MGLALVGSEWESPVWGEEKKKTGVLAADSSPDTVVEAIGKGGAAVIGNVPGASMLITELIRRSVHVMVYDVNTCKPGEWDTLERAATRAGVRLRCGSHLARFAPVMAGVRDYAGGHVSVAIVVEGDPRAPGGLRGPRGLDVCALAADVAMVTFGEAPQAVFAAAPEDPHSYAARRYSEPEDQIFEGAPEGNVRGVADHTAALMRFSGNRAALLSIDALLPTGDVVELVPPDAAYADVEISGHGGLLKQASLGKGTIDARWIGFGPCLGMGISGSVSRAGDEEEDEYEDPGEGLIRYMPAMLAELETGEAPPWPPLEWHEETGVPDVPPWWHTRDAWRAGPPPRASLPPPSSLAHVMEAILVSINTGAPVYLDQR